MKFRIHYTNSMDLEDSVDIEGETLMDVQVQAEQFIATRGIDPESAWSEELP